MLSLLPPRVEQAHPRKKKKKKKKKKSKKKKKNPFGSSQNSACLGVASNDCVRGRTCRRPLNACMPKRFKRG